MKPTVRVWREVDLEVGQPENFQMDAKERETYRLRINSDRGAGIVEFCKAPYGTGPGPYMPMFWCDLDTLEAALAALKER